jgi:hypothetical protein
MRIDQYGVETATLSANNTKSQSSSETSFDNVLARQMKASASGQTRASAETQEVTKNSGVTEKSGPDLVNRVDGLLDTMEEYAGALENGDVSLKAMTPLVQRMDHESKMVADLLGDDDSDDPVVVVAREAVTRAQTETIKFTRGDYV